MVAAVSGRRSSDAVERWLPTNPGAWLMLLAPALIGAVLVVREQGGAVNHLLPMLLCWAFGRCAYSAAIPHLTGIWRTGPDTVPLTTEPGQLIPRVPWLRQRPVVVWTTLSVLCGGLAVAESGWRVLAWAGVYLPLTALALWLCSHSRDGSALTGILSASAACVVPLTLTHPDPAQLQVSAGGAGITLVSLGYLCGAVLHLRALSAPRGLTRRRLVSIGWHALVAAIALVTAAAGGWATGWALFFGLTMIRALLVPLLVPALGRTLRTRAVLVGEGALTLVFCGLALSTLGPVTLA